MTRVILALACLSSCMVVSTDGHPSSQPQPGRRSACVMWYSCGSEGNPPIPGNVCAGPDDDPHDLAYADCINIAIERCPDARFWTCGIECELLDEPCLASD